MEQCFKKAKPCHLSKVPNTLPPLRTQNLGNEQLLSWGGGEASWQRSRHAVSGWECTRDQTWQRKERLKKAHVFHSEKQLPQEAHAVTDNLSAWSLWRTLSRSSITIYWRHHFSSRAVLDPGKRHPTAISFPVISTDQSFYSFVKCWTTICSQMSPLWYSWAAVVLYLACTGESPGNLVKIQILT